MEEKDSSIDCIYLLGNRWCTKCLVSSIVGLSGIVKINYDPYDLGWG